MGNTVGSLDQEQRFVIVGSILGDGYLRRIPGRKNAFLEINHSIKAKDYVDWKFKILKSICVSPPKARVIDEKRTAYRFFTKQHPELTKLCDLFYRNNRKVVPSSLKIKPLTLAVWFMDDGSKSRDRDVYLNTQQFSLNDQRILLYKLRQLGIKARLNKDKKYYRIRLLRESIPLFHKIVGPFIITSMKYKLDS